MMLMWYVLWYVVAVGFLVIVHEFGHFWVARRLGFKVLRFSIGFGKPLLRRPIGADRTELVLAPIPMGGYVKMLDEREGPVAPEELSRSFTHRPPWQRILVLFAGPGANVLFAILLLWVILWANGTTDYKPVVGQVTAASVAARAGLRSGDDITAINGEPVVSQRDVLFNLLDSILSRGQARLAVVDPTGATRTITLAVTDPAQHERLNDLTELLDVLGFEFRQPVIPPVVSQVQAGGPAAQAGLKPGDRIVAVSGKIVHDFKEVEQDIADSPGPSIAIRFIRAGVERSVEVTAKPSGPNGHKLIGVLSVKAQFPRGMVIHRKLAPLPALGAAATEAWDLTAMQARLVWGMVLGEVSIRNLSGPIGIAEYAGESAEAGVAAFASFLVLISLAIALFNLLPIPILDGGQIVFQVAEWVKGRPLSERTQAFGQQVGIALLILLLGVVLFNDVTRQLG
jgi:regulator of sigma E protease